MEYRAIVKRKSSDELQHWKYIKRVKAKGGGWKYFYKDNNLRKHQIGLTETKKYKDKDGIDVKENISYKQTDRLFNTKNTSTAILNNTKYKTTTVSQGKLTRAIAKAEKWIYDNVISDDKKQNNPFVIKNNHSSDKRDKTSKVDMIDIMKKLNEKDKTKKEAEKIEKADVQAKSFAELPKKTREYSKEEDQKAINPNYNESGMEYKTNCSYCTMAYEFRRRGYDVEAAPKLETDDPPTAREIKSWYKGVEDKDVMDILVREDPIGFALGKYDLAEPASYSDLLIKNIKRNGDGARGEIGVQWKQGSGHSMVWEVENGSVVIRDCQINKTYKENEIEDLLSRTWYVNCYRTDNLEFSDEALRTVRYKRKGR